MTYVLGKSLKSSKYILLQSILKAKSIVCLSQDNIGYSESEFPM